MATEPKTYAASALTYENVEPGYLWLSGTDADKLIVDLSGFKGESEFKKEHLKVKIDSSRTIKVSGERSNGRGEQGRRFQKVFRMADDCNTAEIKANYDGGVLSVTMPKLSNDPSPTPPPAKALHASQAPGDSPAFPAQARHANAPDEGKEPAATPAYEKEAEPAATPAYEKEAEPASAREQRPPETRRAERWPTWAAAAAALAVAVGLYYWSRNVGENPSEQQLLPWLMKDFQDYFEDE